MMTPVHTIHQEFNAEDALTSLIREGVREVLAAALEPEVEEHIELFRGADDAEGKRRVRRNERVRPRHISVAKAPRGPAEVPDAWTGHVPSEQTRSRSVQLLSPLEVRAFWVGNLVSLCTGRPQEVDQGASRVPGRTRG